MEYPGDRENISGSSGASYVPPEWMGWKRLFLVYLEQADWGTSGKTLGSLLSIIPTDSKKVCSVLLWAGVSYRNKYVFVSWRVRTMPGSQ